MIRLTYETLERLPITRPVDRLSFIAERCRDKIVLDIGCFDETALVKRNTEHWLHGRIAQVARRVVGVDNSAKIPRDGLVTGENAIILRADAIDLDAHILSRDAYEVLVAGEFIEHLDNPLAFLRKLRQTMAGRELIFSTPNGACFANTLLGAIGREVQHPDHLQNFSFKLLNTLCLRAGFASWEIIPYRFFATEMILASHGSRRLFVVFVERCIRLVERLFPLLSFGYVVRARL